MELLEEIRRGHAAGEIIKDLAKKHGVHRRMVRQAIRNAIPLGRYTHRVAISNPGFPTDPALRAAGHPAQAWQSGIVPAISKHAGDPTGIGVGARQAGPGASAGAVAALSAMSYRRTHALPSATGPPLRLDTS